MMIMSMINYLFLYIIFKVYYQRAGHTFLAVAGSAYGFKQPTTLPTRTWAICCYL